MFYYYCNFYNTIYSFCILYWTFTFLLLSVYIGRKYTSIEWYKQYDLASEEERDKEYKEIIKKNPNNINNIINTGKSINTYMWVLFIIINYGLIFYSIIIKEPNLLFIPFVFSIIFYLYKIYYVNNLRHLNEINWFGVFWHIIFFFTIIFAFLISYDFILLPFLK